jgi:retron-type reverse transcriptase
MKRTGHLFDAAIAPAALYAAYLDARRHKRDSRSCFEFERHLGAQLADLHASLRDGTYRPRPYNTFWVHEPKPRLIHAPAFRDRVVQHAVYRVVQPLFDETFVAQSFACRPGKGTHAAADYVQHALWLAPRDSYFLQLDVRRFYYRIDRTILRGLIERKIKDRRLVDLMMAFAHQDAPLGVPIGNLLSQLYALIYLNPLDHFIKRELRVRHYARYVDDLVLIGLSRDRAAACRAAIVGFLHDRLGLELSRSTLLPIRRGINFVGFRTWASRRFVRKHALYAFRRSARRADLESVISSLGHARRTASLRSLLAYLREHHHAVHRRLPQSYRRLHHAPAAPAGRDARRRPGGRTGQDRRRDLCVAA